MASNLIYFNRCFDKNRLKALILWSLTKSGEKKTIDLVEQLKTFGFHYATQAGLSLGIDDLKIPPKKSELILEAEITVQSAQKDYEIGNLTIIEKFQQLIDVWHRTSEILKQNVVHHFRSTDVLNPVYMMAFSGARGNISQVRQLVGMRGLMADPQGQILDFPIRSNFREGLTLTEYVISCYGARKGLVDTALRTANSGYLTRRLVDVAQHIIVRQLDCGTKNGVLITEMKDGKKVLFSLEKRLIGRVLAEPIEKIAKRNQDISPSLSLKIVKLKNQVLVRSPLTCEAKNSICQLCYGWSLAHGSLVSLGEAVGILAAQSIGEPGTQLTMRTFHTGGVFSGDVMQEIRSPFDGLIKYSNPLQGTLIRTLHGKIAFLTKIEGQLTVLNEKNLLKIDYNIPFSTVLFSRESEYVKERQLLAEYSSVVTTNNQGIQANYNLNSNIEGQVYFEDVLLAVKSAKEGDIIKTALRFGSIWILSGKLYQSSIRSSLFIKSSDLVDTESILNQSVFITPYIGFLNRNSEIKTKYKFLNKKSTYFFHKIEYLKNLLIDKKIIDQNDSILSRLNNKTKNTTNQFQLNQKFSKIYFKKIQYKKFGYFISLPNSINKQIFLTSSLKEKNIPLKKTSLHLLSQLNIGLKGLILLDSNFFNQEKGQVYIIPTNFYKVQPKQIGAIFETDYLQAIQKEEKILFLQNKQANILSILSPKNGFIPNLSHSKYCKIKQCRFNFETINKNFLKNPPLKKHNFNTIKNNYIKVSTLPAYVKINKRKIRKKNFNSEKFIKFKLLLNGYKNKINISKNIFGKLEKIEFRSKTKETTKYLNFKLKTGWNFIPKKTSDIISVNSLFLAPTYKINSYHFDKNYVYVGTNYVKTSIFFLFQTKYLSKMRYIKNISFRYNKTHSLKKNISHFTKNENYFYKDQSLNFFKKESNLNSLLIPSSIIRNKIYKNNLKYKLFFLIEIKKLIELQNLRELEQKKNYQQLTNHDKKLNFFDLNKILFNKQKITKLKNPYPSIDIKIQSIKLNSLQKNKNYIYNPTTIYFSLQKNYPLKKGKLKVEFDQSLNFLINRKIDSINSIFNETENQITTNNKLLLTPTNQVLEQNILSLNSFFSPFRGEITKITTDSIGDEKSLLVTDKDKISFAIKENSVLIKIGQLVRYGDQIFKSIGVTESGQIIQIDKTKITLRKAQPILFSSQGVFHVDNGDIIEKNTPLITLFYQKLKTEDIVQGIPKIEELFEARQTKEGESVQENLNTKLQSFFNHYKQQTTSQDAARKSIEKIQHILVNNVQKVYQSQGVSIADKHIEIIVRQMTTKVKITESGRTGLLRGELIDLDWVEIINLGIEAQNEMTDQGLEVEKAEYEPIILGITKAALETESFISASSFQETTRILSRAAVERKTDFLRGLKENVILGHLIPAGTGFRLSFGSEIKESTNFNKIAWLSYKDIITNFLKNNT